MNLNDVGMAQTRHGLGFTQKASRSSARGVSAGKEHFERHGTLEAQVLRFVQRLPCHRVPHRLHVVSRHARKSR